MTEKHSFTMLDRNSSLSNTKNRKRRFERCGEAGGTAKKPDASVVISVSASQDFTYRPNQPEPWYNNAEPYKLLSNLNKFQCKTTLSLGINH